MKSNSLAALGDHYGLDRGQTTQLRGILQGLRNDERAPTAVTDPGEAAAVHLADSLVGLELEVVQAASRIADLGSGAGFPGIALAIALPDAEVWLVESQRRKCEFLERLCVAANVTNAVVVPARAEQWSAGMSRNDVVVVRALAAQPVVLEYAAPLLRLGGALIDWRGRRNAEEEAAAACAGEQLGFRLVEIRHTEPFAEARHHHLHVYEKMTETPSRFPRRAGIARKRPLGC